MNSTYLQSHKHYIRQAFGDKQAALQNNVPNQPTHAAASRSTFVRMCVVILVSVHSSQTHTPMNIVSRDQRQATEVRQFSGVFGNVRAYNPSKNNRRKSNKSRMHIMHFCLVGFYLFK